MATNLTKTSRISFDGYIMLICRAVAARATCRHREQGAVIVKNKRIISTGYNGAPPGVMDCLERGHCSKAEGLPCLAEGLHGESNAIITAASEGISVGGAAIYCVFSPCRSCCNMLKTAGIAEVVYGEVYEGFPEGPEYLASLGVKVRSCDEQEGKISLRRKVMIDVIDQCTMRLEVIDRQGLVYLHLGKNDGISREGAIGFFNLRGFHPMAGAAGKVEVTEGSDGWLSIEVEGDFYTSHMEKYQTSSEWRREDRRNDQ